MIRFNLDKILNKYKNQFDPPMTITSIARVTGVSRHALNTLIGKNKRPRGINFDTLNKLVSFFDLPPSVFFSYYVDDIKVTLTNAPKQYLSVTDTGNGNEILITIQNIHSPHGKLLIAVQPYQVMVHNNLHLGYSKYKFGAIFKQMNNKNGHHNELFNSFNMDLDKYLRSYIEARIMAHSGFLTKKYARNRHDIHKIEFLPQSTSEQLLSFIVGIKQRDILNPARKLKNESDNSILIDKTTNDFAK